MKEGKTDDNRADKRNGVIKKYGRNKEVNRDAKG
jgi:hypothetical protein